MKKVFLNSVPKAGTNLAIKCLQLLGFKWVGSMDANYVGPTRRGVPWFKRKTDALSFGFQRAYARLADRNTGYMIGTVRPTEYRRHVVDHLCRRVKRGQFIYAHVGENPDLRQKLRSNDFSILFVIRHPIAVTLSAMHYLIKSRRFPSDLEKKGLDERLSIMLNGYSPQEGTPGRRVYPLYDAFARVADWIADPDVLLIRYEDLVGPKGGGSAENQFSIVEEIGRHVGLGENAVSREVIDRIYGGTHTFRKGRIDSWREEIPQPLREDMRTRLKRFIVDWGYNE
ncbi:MAG: hypothetical protein ACFE8Z_04775 [Candidatus Hermodarchaeota archaeon]